MSPQEQSDAYLCGQLYAAVVVLKELGRGHPSRRRLEQRVTSAARHPQNELRVPLGRLITYLARARRRGGANGRAAAEVFRALPGFLTGGQGVPPCLNDVRIPDFRKGCTEQLAAYEEKYDALLPGRGNR